MNDDEYKKFINDLLYDDPEDKEITLTIGIIRELISCATKAGAESYYNFQKKHKEKYQEKIKRTDIFEYPTFIESFNYHSYPKYQSKVTEFKNYPFIDESQALHVNDKKHEAKQVQSQENDIQRDQLSVKV